MHVYNYVEHLMFELFLLCIYEYLMLNIAYDLIILYFRIFFYYFGMIFVEHNIVTIIII